jgi:hypothetical protein
VRRVVHHIPRSTLPFGIEIDMILAGYFLRQSYPKLEFKSIMA